MDFDEFAERAEQIESLSGDHEKADEVASLLRNADDVHVAARFVQGRVFPAWDDRNLDVGPSLLYDALALAGEDSAEEIEERVAETGDIGDVAQELGFGGQQTFGSTAETVSDVYAAFESLASKEGEGSQETKVRELGNLFMDASPLSAKYLARLVLGEMRLGVGEGTVRDAVVEAFDVDAELVERGIMLTNDTGKVAKVARDEGDEGLASLEMVVGRPVKPMLAQTTTVENVFADLDAEEAAVQTKYDGARAQAHLGDETRIFSRSLEDLTNSLPDVVETVERATPDDRDLILDAEVVAVGDDGPLPFQEVLRRIRRKYRVEEMRDEVELEVHVFDILYDGDDGAVIDEALEERHQRLVEAVGKDFVARTAYAEDTESVRGEENVALEEGHEGVVVKHPESTYSPGRRGKNWLKIKPEPETLDLVVTGGEWGEGRRASLVGSYLLSVRGGDGYETVGKVATGLTDEKLEELTELFEDLVVSEDGKEIEFQPSVVFEVGYEEIQRSPVYSSGYALRFPRFLGVRDDKSVEEADTLERLERLYENNE